MLIKSVVVLSILFLSSCKCQITQNGLCSQLSVTPVTNLVLDDLLGSWYEVLRTENDQQNGDCSTVEFTRETESTTAITLRNVVINNNFGEEKNVSLEYSGNGIFTLENSSLSSEPIQLQILQFVANIIVIGYTCIDISATQRDVYIWTLGNEPSHPEIGFGLINTTITPLGIELSQLQEINHSESACYLLPELSLNEPVILPGSCNQNISVVQNFNVERFTGEWHQIYSYYSENSVGTCARAEYTLSGTIVSVLNNEVINQTLRTISGSASVIGTDGSGKLSVTLEVVPGVFVDQELWVLATDYDNYAVLYTCDDLPDNQKRVYSWISGRTSSLSTQAQLAVDATVDSLIELNYRYYIETSRTDDDCFYYPEFIPGQVVVFRGQCDPSIGVVQNFNAAGYLGLWYNIESYPSFFQSGTCNTALYSLNAALGVVDVYNTQVINQTLDYAHGVGVPDPSGEAKLSVSFPLISGDATTDYWVLATDYTSYSLVYSCTNLANNRRSVISWKLGREKQLSSEAETAIANAINNVQVLNQQYYVTDDQSETGCFYYPEPQADTAVVFPGQCDETIAAVSSFDLNQFAGVWHEIQTYPKIQQTGNCVNHNFTNTAAATATLQTTSVTDQSLTSTDGSLSFTSTDGSGKLSLTIGGQTFPYWILATDYTDYALVYSCINLNSTFRSVHSWKLSRNKELSQNANQNIATALASADVLDEIYYVNVGQSDEDCFYLPDLAPDEPVVIVGQCNETIPVVQNFDVARFTGEWHQIYSYYSENSVGTCARAEYTLSGTIVSVLNSEVINQTLRTISGSASVIGTDGSGKLSVTLEVVPGVFINQELWVLATDYDNYAVLYTCENLGNNQRRVNSWINGRTSSLSTEAQLAVDATVDSLVELNYRYYIETNRTDDDCFYYPEFIPGQVVIFRGQCDTNIGVVQNFNAAAYLGLWYNIESYPSFFQSGTCNTALYSLNAALGVVDVYNTQVINQTLDYAHGVGVPDPSGEAKLSVSFPLISGDATTDYWVLATDYTSYSLVYSCANLPNNRRSVISWKLGREKFLTSAANTQIDNTINNVQVLDQQYYQEDDQSETGCFYYPEPQVDTAVVFPGQCDENIAAISSFDLNQFAGVWHEIQTYPKIQQTGNCVNHNFTNTAATTATLQTTSVTDQSLTSTDGSLSFTSTDGSGKLSLTIGGQTFPYWILATDYTDYALVYSCINLNSTFRSVHSWKLSRNKELSQNANQNIATALASADVLDEIYYVNVGQSDEDCFYLPDLAPDEPVVIVGQCNETIPVVQNFDVARFTGEWHQIYSYYSENSVGTCARAEYTLSGTIVSVLNSEVINQTLRTISGSASVIGTDGSGKLSVTLEVVPGVFINQELWVLATDYDNYAVLYTCENLGNNQRRVNSWINGRTSSLSTEAQLAVDATVDSLVELNYRYYIETNRTDDDCFYYPEFIPGQVVIFRGQCDTNIGVVQNFNAAAYLGLWYNIESYPSFFQSGTCNTALYSLNAALGVVDVYNTQVINQTLDYAHGVGVPDPSGEAKLSVSFPLISGDATTDYWVLATDYTSYSLVYSCANLPNNRRSVISWKLGREKFLTSAANTQIDNTINNVQVLDQQYYQEDDQSETGCFYYPEPQVDTAVVFPGQCDENIAAISSFDLNQFAGVWHEIQTYPKIQQTGNCVNHNFINTAATTATLQTTSVTDQSLTSTDGSLSFTSTDGSGKLSLTIGGQTFPYWILATDYTDYALVYSCINLNSTFRSVHSWKLSRNKELSQNANQNIATALASADVLDEIYYVNVGQSDEDCFYLPDLAPDEPVVIVGQCNETIPVVQNFDVARFTGEWHQIYSYYSENSVGTCARAEYTLSGTIVSVLNNEVINQTLRTISGSASVIGIDGSGKLSVTLEVVPGVFINQELWVLATDYDNYAVLYTCENLANNQRRVYSWINGRTSSLSTEAQLAVDATVDSVVELNYRYYIETNRTDDDCFYYPEFIPGQVVVFRGQCDTSIGVVQNFDAAGYLGLWYNIESYPSFFQSGTCNTALYSLNAALGVVDVYNTQVINQTLDYAHGVGVPDPSGEAKLSVSFPLISGDATTDYWVLATDYTSYSLVYSCANLPNNRRSVISWKLGREKVLTSAANTEIDNAINNVQVLDQQYYQEDDQSETGCFYCPEPQTDAPIIFPGQCNENIAAVSNFNFNQFAGTWHEIQTYPKEQQTGECINHNYASSTGSTTTVQSFNVQNETLLSANGDVTFTSTDGSGKLNVRMDNGATFPFWILAVDYNDYALAYSCINLNSTFRSVHAWKLSRNKELSANANQAIANAMESINVLSDDYFKNVSQTDESCFYLPDLAPGEPVTFVGQCDESIPVVQNFNAARYLGRWRMIETYASDFQNGTCNDAQYSLSGDVLIVYNTQVINQTLDTISGNATFVINSSVPKLEVLFPGAEEPSTYWVLDTDYESYSLVYSCRNINSQQRRVWSWKLSRTTALTQAASNAIDQTVSSINVLNQRYYETISHTDDDCFYYPEVTGQPVLFRGQCDESIPAVPNFDAERYMGLWYDIESYPQFFQNGTCPTATYTLTETGVDVFNTQVVAQQLDTINGYAVVVSTDGSAKLNVFFPSAVGDVPAPYWVLATDYDNYAYVYSCTNFGSDLRYVSSWKLSRTTTLSTEAVEAFNNLSENIPVLRQQYFVERGHDDESCFYYPNNFGGPVILNGLCDENQAVVQNFNSAEFAGTWYEAARFPSELQSGECVTNSFVISGNTVTISQSFVEGEQLVSVSGTGTLSNDGTGVINAVLTDGTETRELTLNILATDYSNYALLFSCRNINGTNKQVYSWKLSRSRTNLSDGSNSAIDEVVDNNIDLFNGYYEDTAQSDLACFYYPVFDDTQTSIVLPGPCSVHNVQAQANFQINNYLGRWFEIARYPQPSQVGECAQTDYSSDSGSIIVSSSLVSNSTLDTISGTAVQVSNDNSGIFEITNTLGNGELSVASYYVVGTDYNDYALVYSCRDLESGDSQVASWKLSRSRTLSNQANLAISSLVSNTRGLLESYYRTTSQSDDDCFYIPEFNADQAPLFRGQCSDIPSVQNFDASRYLGWWHEIERYPTGDNFGTCISSRYTQTGNQYQVVDKQIYDTTDQSITSTVQISTDGRITKTSASGTVDIWVLATDYDNYALLYSCETVNEEYIRVWSAKHSKTRQLSQASQDAIAQVIATNRYLQSNFYLAVDQSANGCFYYPEPTGNVVRLPGQCDDAIPTQQNFEVDEYTGTWYQIEKYPQIHESGTCVGARYTLNDETSLVDVLNWEVIDGELETIEGNASVASSDGSAVLSVTLPVGGTEQTMELRVLETDYISYSLVYSCVNIDEYERAIGVWKLSRTRTMLSDGETAITNYMARREELDQRYFLQVEQNDECPEPSSSFLIKSSIISVLVCLLLHYVI